ncbi:MAG: hypothetical protein J6U96_04125 [Elusimicrobiaceae bacterium]|nr:hypothetical protein [Elusimicrobiaceae bacterium]
MAGNIEHNMQSLQFSLYRASKSAVFGLRYRLWFPKSYPHYMRFQKQYEL